MIDEIGVTGTDAKAVVGRVEGEVGGVTVQVLWDLSFGEDDGNGFTCAQHGDSVGAITVPCDPPRHLTPVEHAIAPQGAQTQGDALPHDGTVPSDRSGGHRLALASPAHQITRARIDIGVAGIDWGLQSE